MHTACGPETCSLAFQMLSQSSKTYALIIYKDGLVLSRLRQPQSEGQIHENQMHQWQFGGPPPGWCLSSWFLWRSSSLRLPCGTCAPRLCWRHHPTHMLHLDPLRPQHLWLLFSNTSSDAAMRRCAAWWRTCVRQRLTLEAMSLFIGESTPRNIIPMCWFCRDVWLGFILHDLDQRNGGDRDVVTRQIVQLLQ